MEESEQCDFDELSAMLDEDSSDAVGSGPVTNGNIDAGAHDYSDDDIDEDELDKLLALAEADDDEQESNSSKVQTADPCTTEIKSEPIESVKKEESKTALAKEAAKAAAATNDGQAAMLEEMRRMQERMRELEQKLREKESKSSVSAAPEEPAQPVKEESPNSDVVPSRKWTKTPVRPAAPTTPKSCPKQRKPSGASVDVVGNIFESMGAKDKSRHSSETSKPRKLKDVDINMLFEQTTNVPLKKSESSSVKTERKPSATSTSGAPGPSSAVSAPSAPSAAELFGDSDDSDWEGLDGEKPGSLSGSGKEIQSIIKRGERSRTAHMPSIQPKLSNPKYDEPGSSKSFYSSPGSATKLRQPTSTHSVAPGKSTTSNMSRNAEENNFAPFTNIRIVKPLIPLMSIKARMATRKVIKLSKLYLKTKSADVQESDWITVGVVITKSEPKMSSKGKQFSIWTLSDLEDCDKTVKFFLFGEVHKQLWKTQYGAVIGILNGNIMPSADKFQNKSDEVSMTVDKYEKILLMGAARDLGVCKGRTKAGKECRNAVNKAQGEFCSYHVQAAYKKSSARRGELQNGFSGVIPRSFEKKLSKKGADTYFYGGDMFSMSGGSSVAKKKNQVSVTSITHHQGANLKGKVTTASLHKLLPEDAQKLRELEQHKVEEKNKAFHELLTTPSAGAMNLVKHLVKKEVKKGETVPTNSAQNEKMIESISASQLIKMHKQQIRGVVPRSKPVSLTPAPPSAPPMVGRGLRPGGNVNLDFDLDSSPAQPLMPKITDVKALLAKRKAAAKIRVEGGISKQNPNAIKKLKSPEAQNKIRKRVAEDAAESSSAAESGTPGVPPKKRSRLLGDLDLNSDEVQKLLKKKSKHDGELSEMEQEKLDAYFDVLEKKEQMEQKMDSVRERECSVITCIKCSYTAYKALDTCKEQQHPLRHHKAKQRFFKCKGCSRRITSFEKYPTISCTQCGGNSYERTSMLREKKGPALPQDQLLLRGEERKWINS